MMFARIIPTMMTCFFDMPEDSRCCETDHHSPNGNSPRGECARDTQLSRMYRERDWSSEFAQKCGSNSRFSRKVFCGEERGEVGSTSEHRDLPLATLSTDDGP